MLDSKGPYLLDVMVPYQEHVLPMIPSGHDGARNHQDMTKYTGEAYFSPGERVSEFRTVAYVVVRSSETEASGGPHGGEQ